MIRERGTRMADQTAALIALRSEGLLVREAAELVGITQTYAGALLSKAGYRAGPAPKYTARADAARLMLSHGARQLDVANHLGLSKPRVCQLARQIREAARGPHA